MKTQLTPEDKEKVWRAIDPSWLHYSWHDDQWWTYPVDPRTGPEGSIMSHSASGQVKGVITRPSGFVEVE